MEKKIRDYVRHLDKIDMEVLTDEEVRAEQRKLKFQINLLKFRSKTGSILEHIWD